MKLETLNKCNACESTNTYLIDESHSISCCKNCGYIFDNPRPAFSEIVNFYSKPNHYDPWLGDENAFDLLWKKRIKKIKKHKKEGSLLDVGAGIGQFLHLAKNNFRVAGTEVSDSAIKIAKEKYALGLIKGELESVDFGDEKFDIITIFHVLEHVPVPCSTIKKSRRLLKKEGILIVAVPNDIGSLSAFTRNILSRAKIGRWRGRGKFGFPKITLDGTRDEIHLSHFTPKVLENMLKKNGFDVVENSLDPFYPVKKYKKIADDLFYVLCLGIKKVFGINLYDTIWITAKVKNF